MTPVKKPAASSTAGPTGGEVAIGLVILFLVIRWVIKALLDQANREK